MSHDAPLRSSSAGPVHEPIDGLTTLTSSFERAASRAGRLSGVFRLAGRRCRVVGAGPSMFDLLASTLRHLETDDGEADFTLLAWDRASTGEPLPRLDAGRASVPGQVAPGAPPALLALRQLDQGTFSAFAPRTRLGLFWADDVRACDRVLPLRLFLHWWMSPAGPMLVHAGAVGTAGRGVLVTGAGGRGKSTSCVSALVEGFDYVGDDFVLVDTTDAEVRAHSVSCSARFTAGSLARVPEVADDVVDEGPAADGKRFLVLHPRWRARLVPSVAVDALVVASVAARPESRVVPISSGEALREMVSTLGAIVGDRDVAFRRLAGLARRMPCYRLEAGGERRGVTAALSALVTLRDSA